MIFDNLKVRTFRDKGTLILTQREPCFILFATNEPPSCFVRVEHMNLRRPPFCIYLCKLCTVIMIVLPSHMSPLIHLSLSLSLIIETNKLSVMGIWKFMVGCSELSSQTLCSNMSYQNGFKSTNM